MTENPPSHWDPDCCLLLQGGSNSLDADELNYLYSEQGPTFEERYWQTEACLQLCNLAGGGPEP